MGRGIRGALYLARRLYWLPVLPGAIAVCATAGLLLILCCRSAFVRRAVALWLAAAVHHVMNAWGTVGRPM